MAKPEMKIEYPFEDRLAPKDAADKLASFGVEWDGDKTLKVKGLQAAIELDDDTQKVNFVTGRSFVEITAADSQGSETVLLVSNGSVKMDGQEIKFYSEKGKDATLGELIEEKEKGQVDAAKKKASQLTVMPNFPSSAV